MLGGDHVSVKLKIILPPPSNSSNTGNSEGWSELENNLGSLLPKDYKDFINTYGTGGIDYVRGERIIWGYLLE